MLSDKIYGKVRAFVADVDDPKKMRRIRCRIPLISNSELSTWALPCDSVRRDWLPVPGDVVWVEFEQGEPSFPIWVGLAVAKADVDADFIANYGSDYRKDRDPNGNYIKWTSDQGSPTGKAIHINGTKRLSREEHLEWLSTQMFIWIKTHKHMGNSGQPTPLFPSDRAALIALIADYDTKRAVGGIFLTNLLMGE